MKRSVVRVMGGGLDSELGYTASLVRIICKCIPATMNIVAVVAMGRWS